MVCRLMWNSRSHQLVGLVMSHEELATLTDVYQLLDPECRSKQTTYILQFLWCDLTSPFDVIGPYFTSSGTLESKFLLSCVLESIKAFHLYRFKMYALVCDAAAPNVSVVKATTGVHGAYGNSEVKPEFKNPFDPTRMAYWIFCLSHQVYTQIVKLYIAHNLCIMCIHTYKCISYCATYIYMYLCCILYIY